MLGVLLGDRHGDEGSARFWKGWKQAFGIGLGKEPSAVTSTFSYSKAKNELKFRRGGTNRVERTNAEGGKNSPNHKSCRQSGSRERLELQGVAQSPLGVSEVQYHCLQFKSLLKEVQKRGDERGLTLLPGRKNTAHLCPVGKFCILARQGPAGACACFAKSESPASHGGEALPARRRMWSSISWRKGAQLGSLGSASR